MLAKFFITVSGFTLLSRIFGFVRDILFAAFLGTGQRESKKTGRKHICTSACYTNIYRNII